MIATPNASWLLAQLISITNVAWRRQQHIEPLGPMCGVVSSNVWPTSSSCRIQGMQFWAGRQFVYHKVIISDQLIDLWYGNRYIYGWAMWVMLSFVQKVGNHVWWAAIWGWKSGEDVKEREPSLTYGVLVAGSKCWARKGLFSMKPSSTRELLKFDIWWWPHTQPQIHLLIQYSCVDEFSKQMLPLAYLQIFFRVWCVWQQWDSET